MIEAVVEEGPWKGWTAWRAGPEGRFLDGLGDVYYRPATFPEGAGMLASIDTLHRHTNGLGYLHGGFLMAFVDVAMSATVRHLLDTGAVVTVQCSTDFLGPGKAGVPLEARGRIVRETGRLVWVAGTLTQHDGSQLVAQWHGLMRKLTRAA